MSDASDLSRTRERRFFLAVTPQEGEPELEAGELRHARGVLRLGAGDELLGLDGRGSAYPLRVVESSPRRFAIAPDGPARCEPEPGAEGARLAWIELLAPLPRGARADELVERATQLGASALRWILTERTPPRSREPSEQRIARLRRIAAEATKQCGRLWLPRIDAPAPLAQLIPALPKGALVLLDPAREAEPLALLLARLSAAAAQSFSRARPLQLVAGPEGGFTAAELALLESRGAARARLAPYVLRIETAAEAAIAIAAHGAY